MNNNTTPMVGKQEKKKKKKKKKNGLTLSHKILSLVKTNEVLIIGPVFTSKCLNVLGKISTREDNYQISERGIILMAV